MTETGPPLDRLLHRLADCPPEFLLAAGEIDVVALACDHFRALRCRILTPPQRRLLVGLPSDAQRLLAIVLWLLRDDWFIARPELAERTWWLLQSDALTHLPKLVGPDATINDPDRREELVRLCLRGMGLHPDGESAAQAADRFTTLDSVERERVIRQTRQAEARSKEIRAAMARKRAEEAASRYSPE